MDAIETFDPVALWPHGAPGALGDSPADRPQLTLFRPASAGGTPACVIVCPGGGYGALAAHEGEPVARWLCGLGLSAAVLRYRVAPYCHPIPLADAQRAIRLARANAGDWNIDVARVGILGFSAGGHLAISAAAIQDNALPPADAIDRLPSRPDALIACYPVVSFLRQPVVGVIKRLLGDSPDQRLLEQLSLETRVGPHVPPTFLWHTADDKSVPVRHSLLLADALARHGVSFALNVFARGAHGLGLARNHPAAGQWPALCARWLGDVGFAPPVV
jgi:acetyl esterase/lipase